MIRIRYKKQAGFLITNKCILLNNQWVNVVIYPDDFKYVIEPTDSQHYIAKGKGTSLASAKMKVKRVLRELGANFQDEIRVRGSTEKL